MQLAHAYEIMSHALTKFVQNNGRDELPSDIRKQVCDLSKDTATQLSSQINDGKCNWLLLSSVIQTLNYLKIICAHNCQQFTLDTQLIESLKQITGKNRKKLPKPGQIALKGLLNGYVHLSLSFFTPVNRYASLIQLIIYPLQVQRKEK